MKILYKSSVVFFIAIFLIGCTRGTGGSDTSSAGQYYIRMSVDGAAKSGKASTSYLQKYTATIGGVQQNLKHLLIATGGFGGNATETITLNMANFTGVGTYSLADNPETTAQYAKVASDPNQIYGAQSGKIVITEYNAPSVKGTFEFVGQTNAGATVHITIGEFYLPVTEQ